MAQCPLSLLGFEEVVPVDAKAKVYRRRFSIRDRLARNRTRRRGI